MTLIKTWATFGFGTLLAVNLVGCGQAMTSSQFKDQKTTNASTSPTSGVNLVSAQMASVRTASDDVQAAIVSAQALMAQLVDAQGNVNLSLFTSSSSSPGNGPAIGILAPIVNEVRSVFDQVFAKVTAVKGQFDTVRATLTTVLNSLNPNDPLQSAEIDQIKSMLAELSNLEQAFQTAMHDLSGKVGQASVALDNVIARATAGLNTKIPGLGLIAGLLIDTFVTGDVKDLLNTVQSKLASV